jgi:hypothetical protein
MDKTFFKSSDGRLVKSKIDPFLYLALTSNFADFNRHSDGSFDCMVELENAFAAYKIFLATLKIAQIPIESTIYRKDFPVPFYTGKLNEAVLMALCLIPDVVKRVQLASPLIAPRARLRQFRPAAGTTVSESSGGSSTLLALIDDGCPFAHPMLKTDSGALRLRALWDQDRAPDFSALGKQPPGFGYGVEVGRTALEMHIKRNTTSNGKLKTIDQDACYSSLNYQSAFKGVSHGAHSIGMILNGNRYKPDPHNLNLFIKNHDGADPTADFLFVQLPRDVTAVPFHGARLRSILDGIRWILDKSSAQETNIVVAIPYGSMLGPHDGSGVFTKALDLLHLAALNRGKTLQIVLAAGNEYEANLHASKNMPLNDDDQVFKVRVAPESELPTFVEVWIPKSEVIKLIVEDPRGRRVNSGSAECSVVNTGWYGLNSEVTLIRIAPTKASRMNQVTAIAGDWVLFLDKSQNAVGAVHCYISKARGGLESLLRGNQARFVVPAKLTKEQVDKCYRQGSISDAITGTYSIGVGGYKSWQWVNEAEPAKYSSSGPAASGVRALGGLESPGPNVSMPCEQSPMLYGFRNAGNRAANTFRMNGTSAAASYYAARVGRDKSAETVPPDTYPSVTEIEKFRLGVRHI